MCLIISKEEGSDISREFIENVRKKNPHGWGILYHNRAGEAKVAKGLDMESFWEKYSQFVKYDAECIIHFRYATKGKVNKANAHPYKVLGGDKPIYLMHNGTISIEGAQKGGKYSDTRVFIRDVLTPMLGHIKDPHKFIRTKHFDFLMESVAGDNNSRFVLFDHEGSLFYGGWHKTTKGVWVSNTYAFDVDNPNRQQTNVTRYNSGWSYTDKYANGYYDQYDDDGQYVDTEEAWVKSVQDVADNFELIAEHHWNLVDEEIEYSIQNFYSGVWVFELDEVHPQHSIIRDLDGLVIEPSEIEVMMQLDQANLIHNQKKTAGGHA